MCDEATSALDPQTTQSILQLLKRINAEYNITVMIITHEMSVIQEICNKVAVMEEGRIIEQGSVLDVFGEPKHQTTQNFVKTVIQNSMTSSVRRTLKTEQGSRVYKLNFAGESASEPVLYEIIRSYSVKVNILFANTTEIQETTLGTIIVQLQGDPAQLEAALNYMKQHEVRVEEVKSYVLDIDHK